MPDAAKEAPRAVRFGPFEVDLRAEELRKNGLKIRLQGQPFQVLRLLLQRPGELVTREEIKQALWPSDTFVDFEVNINAAVKRLRQVLDDSAETPHFIETRPKRGYRFIYPLQNGQPSTTAPSSSRWQKVATAISALTILLSGVWQVARVMERRSVAGITSLAVLPLENLTGDPEQLYIVDGIHDELITELSHISAWKVISRTSVMQYRQQKKHLTEIAEELGVNGIVEGTVRLGGDSVRISVQLISARDDRHLWAQNFESAPRDLTRLPARIVLDLTEKLHVQLTPQERQALNDARGLDPAAWKLMFKARYFTNKVTRESLWKAVGYYREALDIDPTYAPAWLGMAWCYEMLQREIGQDTKPNAIDALQKAIQLDPRIRQPHQTLGRIRLDEWDWAGAEREFQRAREVDPSWPGDPVFLLITGKPEEAVNAARRAAEADPLTYLTQLTLGWTYFMARHYDESMAQLQKTIRLDPAVPVGYLDLALGYAKKGMFNEAIRNCETSLAKLQGKLPEKVHLGFCGWVYAVAGHHREALTAITALEKYGDFSVIALVYEGLGDRNRFLQCLEQAYAERSGPWVAHALFNPMVSDETRADPRFQEMVRKTGIPWAWVANQPHNRWARKE